MAEQKTVSEALDELNREELIGIARKVAVPGRAQMRKGELQTALAHVPEIRKLVEQVHGGGRTTESGRSAERGKGPAVRGGLKERSIPNSKTMTQKRDSVPKKKRQAAAPAARRAEAARTPRGLPVNEARLVLMVTDPFWAFAYWSTKPAVIDLARRWIGDLEAQLVLRFYDLGTTAVDPAHAESSFDIEIDEPCGNYYLNLWTAGKRLSAELGVRSTDGTFAAVTRSNRVSVPRAEEAELYDDRERPLHRTVTSLWRPRRTLRGEGALSEVEVDEAAGAETAPHPGWDAAAFPDASTVVDLEGAAAPGGATTDGPLQVPDDWETGIGLSSGELTGAVFSSHSVARDDGQMGVEIRADLLLRGWAPPGTQLVIEGVSVPQTTDGSFAVRFSFPVNAGADSVPPKPGPSQDVESPFDEDR